MPLPVCKLINYQDCRIDARIDDLLLIRATLVTAMEAAVTT